MRAEVQGGRRKERIPHQEDVASWVERAPARSQTAGPTWLFAPSGPHGYCDLLEACQAGLTGPSAPRTPRTWLGAGWREIAFSGLYVRLLSLDTSYNGWIAGQTSSRTPARAGNCLDFAPFPRLRGLGRARRPPATWRGGWGWWALGTWPWACPFLPSPDVPPASWGGWRGAVVKGCHLRG